MISHLLKVSPSSQNLPRKDQLAWKLAQVATDPVPVEKEVCEMIGNRIIDNAAVALAAINRTPVANARAQAVCHAREGGSTLWGIPAEQTFSAEWAAWANGTAVRELDMHDTFLAADYSHPGDNIPPLLAVAQQTGRNGADLVRGIAAAYETQINLVKGICLHQFKKDHIAHLAPSVACGLGSLLDLDANVLFHAIGQAVHCGFSTRQSRKGEISSWKAYAPAWAGKIGIESVDRCMRGEAAPSPIYEGEDSVLAWMLGGPDARHEIPLPEPGEPKRAILESYTKEHSAEYQSQALIDLAIRMRQDLPDLETIESITIHTSHHTHFVIGTGSGDPQKFDPGASRETLDHSIMYIFAVALQDGRWHHVDSYTPDRASRPDTVALWKKIRTVEDPAWTRAYHNPDPSGKKFGGRVDVLFKDGSHRSDELGVANAHPNGATPFRRADYIRKFQILTEGIVSEQEADRFLHLVDKIQNLSAVDLRQLTLGSLQIPLDCATRDERGIF